MLVDRQGKLSKPTNKLLFVMAMVPILLGFAFLVRMPLSWTDQTIFSGLIIVCCIALGRLSDSRFMTSMITLVSIFCTLRYVIWRWSSSVTYLDNSGWSVDKVGLVFALLLLCAETYSVVILLLGYFQSARPLKRKPLPLPADTDQWPSVDIFVPTYNEPLDVVRPTVLAAMGIDWPLDRMKVYILDDGRREEFRKFAEECGCAYLTRFDNAHAKAGNINSALKKTSAEYIAIFDCDHIATRSFLQLTMGWFRTDKKLAMVQTPHHFYSPDPFERNLNVFRKIPNEGALFYGVVQDGNDLWNATFFCGSCAVIKREALEQIGGIAVETVTEDAHTALRLQRLGWNTAYIGIPQAAGLATGSLSAHVGQRIRWARGMVQILRTDCPLFASGLTLPQRLCYLNCVVHYLYAIPRLIFVSAPLVYLLLGKSNLYGYIWEIMAYAAPHLVLSNMVNSRSQGDHRHSFWNELYEMVLAPYILLPTTFALINPKWGKFNVTAKSSMVDDSFFDWKIARPYLALIALNVIAIAVAIPKYFMSADPSGVVIVNVIWALLNMLMLGACVAVSYETKQRRSTVRVEASLTPTLVLRDGETHNCSLIDFSEGGLALRSDRILTSAPGDLATVVFRTANEESKFAVQAVRVSDNRIHMRFLANDLAHQREITKMVYARADSWLDWTKDQRRDRILSSLITVFAIGAQGIWMLPSLFIKRESKGKAGKAKTALARSAMPGILLGALLLPFWKGHAQQTPVAPVAPATQEVFRDQQSFADLGRKTALVLHGDKAKASFGFSVPATKIVDSSELAIHYQAGELDSTSEFDLAVSVNDVEVSSVKVPGGTSAPDVAHITVPADLLVHDNMLQFELRQVCVLPCKQKSADAAWVRVEPTSELESTGVVLPLPNRLSILPSPFFDPAVHHSIEVPLVFDAQPDLPMLKAAGVLASSYGALAKYRGSHFTASIGTFPKGNIVLLAHSGSPLASQLGLAGAEAQVAICDNPSDRYGKVLALVANSGANLLRLSQLVARNAFHEDTDRVFVGVDRLSDTAVVSDASAAVNTKVLVDQPLHITNDLAEDLLHAKPGVPTKLYFQLPADLDYGSHISVPLHLAFRLAGLSTEDHVWISIRLNGTFVAKRYLSSSDCKGMQMQSWAIPVTLLYPNNTLSIELLTNRSDAMVADPSVVDLQVLPATNLDLKGPTHFVRMPRLDLFAASGYPFTVDPSLAETAFVMPADATAAQLGLFLDAVGFMSAQTGVVATKFDLMSSKDAGEDGDRNFVVIGSSNDEATFRPFERSMMLIPSNGSFDMGENTLTWQEWLSRAWLGRREEMREVSSLVDHDGGPKFILQQFISPFRGDRTVVVLATKSATDDERYFDRLADAAREGHIRGGVAVAGDGPFQSFQLSARSYTLGEHRSLSAVYSWLRFHLWILPLCLIAAAALGARWWENLLARQAAKRLQAAL